MWLGIVRMIVLGQIDGLGSCILRTTELRIRDPEIVMILVGETPTLSCIVIMCIIYI
jgi:hypothetical protein